MITELTVVELVTMPEKKEPGILYYSERFALAIHLCACGCGGQAVTPIKTKETDGWVLTLKDPDGPTLNHSIGHQHWPCGSHYHVRNGKIVLYDDHGRSTRKKNHV